MTETHVEHPTFARGGHVHLVLQFPVTTELDAQQINPATPHWVAFSPQITAHVMMGTPAQLMPAMKPLDASVLTWATEVLATMEPNAPSETHAKTVPALEPMTIVMMGLSALQTPATKPRDARTRPSIPHAMTELPVLRTPAVGLPAAHKPPTTALVTTEKVALKIFVLRESDASTEGGITETSVMMETTARTMIPALEGHALGTPLSVAYRPYQAIFAAARKRTNW